jgi:hypothetical protein
MYVQRSLLRVQDLQILQALSKGRRKLRRVQTARLREAGMKPTAFQVHKSWLIPALLVLVVTVSADGVVGWFAAKPFPWVVLIPGSLPLSMFFFVARPLLKQAEQES